MISSSKSFFFQVIDILNRVKVTQPLCIADVSLCSKAANFYLVLRPKASTLEEALLRVIQQLAENSYRVLHLTTHRREDLLKVHCLVELSTSKVPFNSFIRQLMDLFKGEIIEVKWEEREAANPCYGSLAFPYVICFLGREEEVAAFSLRGWIAFFRELHSKFGSGGLAILWYVGKAMGEYMARQFKKEFPELSAEQLIALGFARLQSFGWAKLEIATIDLETPYLVLRAYQSLEMRIEEAMQEYAGLLIKGLLEGYMPVILGKLCRVVRSKYRAGKTLYCEYVVERAGGESPAAAES